MAKETAGAKALAGTAATKAAKAPARPKVPQTPPEPVRRFTALPLAQLLPGITRTAYRKRSPAGATLMADWATIMGPQLAALTEPRRLARGVLTIACGGPTAMELAHLQPMLIERINTHAGTRVVDALRFVQAHISPPAPPASRTPRGTPEKISDMEDGPLADALALLRQAMREKKE